LFLFSVHASAESAPAQPSIVVTIYDLVGLPAAVREGVKAETGRIFLQAGIRVEWVECELSGRPMNVSACALPLGARRLMLQWLPGRHGKNPRAAGMAILQNGSGVLACLYPERIQELARDANWDFADLMGHAAAHELGHLVLESSRHSNAGVMRAPWEIEDIRGLPHNGLIFLTGQLSRARVRLQADVR
jgi:hypothetical protein